jgi:hypothetical protein
LLVNSKEKNFIFLPKFSFGIANLQNFF